MPKLEPGDKAPIFALLDQHGHMRKSSEFRGAPLFVYFYPKANTSGCTTQSCSVRDAMPKLGKIEVAAVGISPDEPEAQMEFDEEYGLGFPLLCDPDHATAEHYGVWGEKSMYGKKYMGIVRSAFLIDAKGDVQATWYKVSPANTVPFLMEALAGSE